jgi:hypothetical protein
MSKEKLIKGQNIYLTNQKLPYKIMALSERFAVCSRKLNRREDASLLHHEVKMGAFCSFTEAFNYNKSEPVYTIIDFQENINAPDNLVLGGYDYFKEKDCKKVIKDLEKGELELSHRHRVKLSVDWDKTTVITSA